MRPRISFLQSSSSSRGAARRACGSLLLLLLLLLVVVLTAAAAFVAPLGGGGARLPSSRGSVTPPARGAVLGRRSSPTTTSLAAAEGGGNDAAGATDIRTFTVEPSSAKYAMDIVLARQYPQLSRRACRRLLQEGHVAVDGRVMRRFGKVGKGATVQVTLPADTASAVEGEKGGGSVGLLGLKIEPEAMDLAVLHEDEWLLAVNKPPGLVVQPCESAANGTLLHGVVHHLMENTGREATKEAPILASPTQAIVHRLDKDTSGVVLLAKTLLAARRLAALFKTRAVSKTYLALCHGDPCGGTAAAGGSDDGVTVVQQPIFRKPNGKMAVPTTEEERLKARRAVSRVETIATDGSISLVRVQILTGRTHQIRVHLASAGCPVLGDDLYGGAAFTGKNRRFRRLGMKRILLHAYALSLNHPFASGQAALELLAPVPTDILATARYVLQREKGKTTKPSASATKPPPPPPTDDKENDEKGEDKAQADAGLRLLRALRDGKALTPSLLLSAGLRPLSPLPSSSSSRGVEDGDGGEEEEEENDDDDDEEDWRC